MTTVEVGQFTYDTQTGTLTGPKTFMESGDYASWLADVKAGRDVVLNFGASGRYGASPNFETALLVSLQTCYAGWHGRETFARAYCGGTK